MPVAPPDVVFIFPPAYGNAGCFKDHLGVSYLRAQLAEVGITSRQYVNPCPGTIKQVVRELIAMRAGIVGLTAYHSNFPLCLAIAKGVKQLRPETKVILGGPAATFSAEDLLSRHTAIDLAVVGEAEETAPAVLTKLLTDKLLDQHDKGIVYRQDGKILRTGDACLIGVVPAGSKTSLDIVPSPYLKGVMADGRAGVLTGRGCTHQCQYCCFAALGKRTLRLHSVDRVVAELEIIYAHQRRSHESYAITIHDDAFTLLPARAMALCAAIAASKIKLRISCTTRADTVDRELLETMRAAGVVSIAYGLESAVPSVLRAIGKVRPPNFPDSDLAPEREFIARVRDGVTTAKKLGLTVGVSIILGLPTETPADARATLQYVRGLPVDYYAHNVINVFPGTPLWDTGKRYGLECGLDSMGVPEVRSYPYDVTALRPVHRSDLQRHAHLLRTTVMNALTSCESPAIGKAIDTAILTAPALTSAAADWLAEVLSIGGTLVQIYPRSIGRRIGAQLMRDRCAFSDHLIPARYYVQLVEKGHVNGSSNYRILCAVTDLYSRHHPRLMNVRFGNTAESLLEWMRGRVACDFCEVPPEMLTSAALAGLTRQLAASSRSPLHSMPVPPRFQHGGRWLRGPKNCGSLTRIEVDISGNIRCCRLGHPIGHVGDDYKALCKGLSRACRRVEQIRGCKGCPERPKCPQCSFPGITDAAYCGVIRTSRKERDTLSQIDLYSWLCATVTRPLEWNS